jgi:predicted choloylglycine hydrolase
MTLTGIKSAGTSFWCGKGENFGLVHNYDYNDSVYDGSVLENEEKKSTGLSLRNWE